MSERTALATKASENKGRASLATKSNEKHSQSIDSPVEQIFQLQQTIGNQAVQRLIESGTLQAKLKIGKSNDKYEQEADRVAERVISMPESKQSLVNGHSSLVQRQETEEEEEPVQTKLLQRQETEEEKEPVQTKLLQRQEGEEEEEVQTKLQRKEEDEDIQAKQAPNQAPAVTSNIESGIQSLKGGGQPLPESTRSYFEPRFGADFSQVRVHTDSHAAETARSINAKAFTTGKDVVFGAGQYSPGTSEGKRLLAHELTHVVQQDTKKTPLTKYPIPKKNSVTGKHAPEIQRFGLSLLLNVGSNLVGKIWLQLSTSWKKRLINKAISISLTIANKFPGKYVLGAFWLFFKEGWIGFLHKLKSSPMKIKIRAMDNIARIMAGMSPGYTWAFVKGLLKGFFRDGLLGIFFAIGALIKNLKNLWSFFAAVGKLIGGFPKRIQGIIGDVRNIGRYLANNIGTAIRSLAKFMLNPGRMMSLFFTVVKFGKSLMRKAGGKIADGMLQFFSKPGAGARTGAIVGHTIGVLLFEGIFIALTAGVGAAVTAAKTGVRILVRIGAQIVGSVLKIFRNLHRIFGTVLWVVKAAAKFVKGKFLGKLMAKFQSLLIKIRDFAKMILKHCKQKSPLKCDFEVAKVIIKFTDEISKLRLKGKSFNTGKRMLKNKGLVERITKSGRHEFSDKLGRVRVVYDPVSQKGGGHWHKFGYKKGQRFSLSDSGRVVSKKSTAAHIKRR